MEKVIGYIRVSTDKQDNSADDQRKRIGLYTELHGMHLVDIIEDVDQFSGDLDRPGAQQVLKMVRAKSVNGVVFTKLDRLTRSTRDVIDLMELFAKSKVAFVCIDQELNTESPMGRFVVRLMASLGEMERELIGSRTRDGMRNIKSQGMPVGQAPYGWSSQPRTAEEKILKMRKKLLRNDTEQVVISIARELRSAGKSYREIADHLNTSGHKTRSGGEWVYQYVIGILKDVSGVAA